jgi:hypothetical protein
VAKFNPVRSDHNRIGCKGTQKERH